MKVVIDFEPSIHSFNSYIECTIMEHISKVSKAVFKAYPFEYIYLCINKKLTRYKYHLI